MTRRWACEENNYSSLFYNDGNFEIKAHFIRFYFGVNLLKNWISPCSLKDNFPHFTTRHVLSFCFKLDFSERILRSMLNLMLLFLRNKHHCHIKWVTSSITGQFWRSAKKNNQSESRVWLSVRVWSEFLFSNLNLPLSYWQRLKDRPL